MIELMMVAVGATPNGEAVFLAEDGAQRQWIVPAGVKEICILCVGAGGVKTVSHGLAGAGGGVAWSNNVPVTPGDVLTVRVGKRYSTLGAATRNSTASYVMRSGSFVTRAYGGGEGDEYGFASTGDGGGSGGAASYGAGGAGGYTGNGGKGGAANFDPLPGSGGGGGGAFIVGGSGQYHGGGGFGLYGLGTNGAAGTSASRGGKAGSRGKDGTATAGGDFGGGAPWASGAIAGRGAVRILWGQKRAFPSTNVDEASSETVETY